MAAQMLEPLYIGGDTMVAYKGRVFGLTPAGRLVEILDVAFGKVMKVEGVDKLMAMKVSIPKGVSLRSEDGTTYTHERDTLYVPADVSFRERRKPGAKLTLRVKHRLMREEQSFARMRREVEAFENMEAIEHSGAAREPIAESVRLFVWQRDKGQCVKCGARERLEFDHVIPVVKGGSSTERNVQLLCESCNRSKGAEI
jgi:hypothetical protein